MTHITTVAAHYRTRLIVNTALFKFCKYIKHK